MEFNGYKYKFKFNASHYIDYMHPENVHSHTFHVIFYLENYENEFVAYNQIEKYMKTFLDNYRGKCLNLIYPFDRITPTLENICKEIYKNVKEYCNEVGTDLLKVEISDNSISWYSLSESLLIDSLNETINDYKINDFLQKNPNLQEYLKDSKTISTNSSSILIDNKTNVDNVFKKDKKQLNNFLEIYLNMENQNPYKK